MTILDYLAYLRSLDIQLGADGDNLRVNAPGGVLTPSLRRELAERKPDILAFLHSPGLASGPNTLQLQPARRDGGLPLSFSQQRIWFMDQLDPESPTYNIVNVIRMRGLLKVETLQKVFDAIVARHEVLRTTFHAVAGVPISVIGESRPVPMSLIDLNELPEAEREAKAHLLIREKSQQPFDLSQDLMLRTVLLRLDQEEHLLLLMAHHIAFDDIWSMGIFYNEMTALYKAFCENKPSPLSDLPIQYADFAQWQNQWLQGEELMSQLSYWRRRLGNHSPTLDLPTDHQRPAVKTYHGARLPVDLPKALSESLKEIGRRQGATLFMVLLAAFKALLYRYSGQEDIIVGSPIAGRTLPQTTGLIGFFINNLVLRSDLSDNPSFRELLARVREVTLGAYSHQDIPYEKLVEEFSPERDLSRNPLFQVAFTLQNVPKFELILPGLSVNFEEVDNGTSRFDMSFYLGENNEGLKGAIRYSTDLFEEATIARMVGHYRVLLEGIVANPERHLLELPLATEAERHQVLVEWNNTWAECPRDLCIHQLFEAQAEQALEAIAIACAGEQVTYRELDQRANQLGHYLQGLGVGPESLVGIRVERSVDMVVGMLGIFKAGGAYVPFDPKDSGGRLTFMLEDAQVSVLLTQAHLLEKLPGHSAKLVCLDTDREIIERERVEKPISSATPDNLAYVIYTSGSTGRPKGVAIEHRNSVAFLDWATRTFSPVDLAGVLASTSICFDISVFELFAPLCSGGKVIIAENLLQLPNLAAAEEVTLINTVPTAIAELLRFNGIPSSVRIVNLAGEPLQDYIVDRLYQQPGIQKVFDLYGPTETTTYSTFAWRECNGPVTIGRPVNNAQVYLLDAYLNPVPIGVSGELYIGGAGVARGYLNRPSLTAERFLHCPFSYELDARMYKTGDIGRYLADGNIEFLGRNDNQVKIRGFRIELGEIEATLRQHPNVEEVVVLAREDSPGDKTLAAYVVWDQDGKPGTRELRRLVKEKLPDYMMPGAFVTLDTFPQTPNGKVDRLALPAPDKTGPELEPNFVAPRYPVEEALAGIWSEVLGLDLVGIHDNFFDLGGHSLLATRVNARIFSIFGVDLPLRSLFETDTVAELATVITQKLAKELGQKLIAPL